MNKPSSHHLTRLALILTILSGMALAQGPPPGFVRTPDSRFENLADFPYEPQYLTFEDGVRMHFIDEGGGDPILLLHGQPTWSYVYRDVIEALVPEGRVVAPDMIGFGRSDKGIHPSQYSSAMHLERLQGFIEELDLINITLVGHDWGALFGLVLAAEMPDRFARLVILNGPVWSISGKYGPESQGGPSEAFLQYRQLAESWPDVSASALIQSATVKQLPPEVLTAYDAPFPDFPHRAAIRTFPLLVPITTLDPAAIRFWAAGQRLKQWKRPAFVMFSDLDAFSKGGDAQLRALIPTAQQEPIVTIQASGHFVQEDATHDLIREILAFLERRPINPKRLRK
ncbi:MAG: haloalkane dehalogenase [Planctomycetota bacterium]